MHKHSIVKATVNTDTLHTAFIHLQPSCLERSRSEAYLLPIGVARVSHLVCLKAQLARIPNKTNSTTHHIGTAFLLANSKLTPIHQLNASNIVYQVAAMLTLLTEIRNKTDFADSGNCCQFP